MIRNCPLTCFAMLLAWFCGDSFDRIFAQESATKLRFNQDIRPILSSACYRCHGMDAKTREADLRLDTAEAARTPREGGKVAIAPGKLDESLIWSRIMSSDPETVMPPPNSNRQLSESEKKTIGLNKVRLTKSTGRSNLSSPKKMRNHRLMICSPWNKNEKDYPPKRQRMQ